MSYLGRLPPDYRRRFIINIAILATIVLGLTNVWRLGPANGGIAILAVLALCALYAPGFCGFRLFRANPRPGSVAYVIYGLWTASLVWLTLAFTLNVPGALLAALAYCALMWTFFIAYRRIVFPKFGERFRAVRQAQRDARADQRSKDDLRAMFSRGNDHPGGTP